MNYSGVVQTKIKIKSYITSGYNLAANSTFNILFVLKTFNSAAVHMATFVLEWFKWRFFLQLKPKRNVPFDRRTPSSLAVILSSSHTVLLFFFSCFHGHGSKQGATSAAKMNDLERDNQIETHQMGVGASSQRDNYTLLM